jgi:heme oxygenase-like protein
MRTVTEAPPLGNAERLRGTIDLVVTKLFSAGGRLVTHARVRDLYPEYLFTLHSVIRSSVPLMEMARDRARSMAPGDRVAELLAEYLDKHIEEERDHDDWLLDDLESIGVERSSTLARVPSPTVARAVGAQYYWVLHYHPVALLGWIGLLEGYPPTPETIDVLVAGTGYGPEAFRTLSAHAVLDVGHRDELFDLIDRLPLTADQSKVIGLSALSSIDLLAHALDEVTALVG